MITPEEARRYADRWVARSAPPGVALTAEVREFDVGYVIWGVTPPGTPALVGAGRGVIDKETGETSVWPSLPVERVVADYQARRAASPPPRYTWSRAADLRRELERVATPATVTHLTTADGAERTARSMKGDGEPDHHRLVADFLAVLPVELRERGYDRCSEVAALSDALHAEDARRVAAGDRPVSLAEVRDDLLRGASLRTYRVREPGDPTGGRTGPPCVSCILLLRHFGFDLTDIADEAAEGAAGPDGPDERYGPTGEEG